METQSWTTTRPNRTNTARHPSRSMICSGENSSSANGRLMMKPSKLGSNVRRKRSCWPPGRRRLALVGADPACMREGHVLSQARIQALYADTSLPTGGASQPARRPTSAASRRQVCAFFKYAKLIIMVSPRKTEPFVALSSLPPGKQEHHLSNLSRRCVIANMIKILKEAPVDVVAMACDRCHVAMVHEDQIAGLLQGNACNIFRCTRCEQMVRKTQDGKTAHRTKPKPRLNA